MKVLTLNMIWMKVIKISAAIICKVCVKIRRIKYFRTGLSFRNYRFWNRFWLVFIIIVKIVFRLVSMQTLIKEKDCKVEIEKGFQTKNYKNNFHANLKT